MPEPNMMADSASFYAGASLPFTTCRGSTTVCHLSAEALEECATLHWHSMVGKEGSCRMLGRMKPLPFKTGLCGELRVGLH